MDLHWTNQIIHTLAYLISSEYGGGFMFEFDYPDGQ